MRRLLRFVIAIASTAVLTPLAIWGVSWCLGTPGASFSPRLEAVMTAVFAFIIFGYLFANLVNLPNIIATWAAAYATMEALSDQLDWLLAPTGNLPELFWYLYGLGLLIFASIWGRVLRLPKLTFLMG